MFFNVFFNLAFGASFFTPWAHFGPKTTPKASKINPKLPQNHCLGPLFPQMGEPLIFDDSTMKKLCFSSSGGSPSAAKSKKKRACAPDGNKTVKNVASARSGSTFY